MTPKEEAKELVDKCFNANKGHFYQDCPEEDLEAAKECALVVVNEILEILPTNEYLEDVGKYIENRQRVYYKEVKQEIEKIQL